MKKRFLILVSGLFGLILAAGPVRAESRMEKTLKLEPGGEFSIDTDTGRVTVTGASISGVHIVVTARRELDDLLRFDFQEGARKASVIARKRHPVSTWFGDSNAGVRFEIELPAQTTVKVHTSGGAISLAGTRAPARLDRGLCTGQE